MNKNIKKISTQGIIICSLAGLFYLYDYFIQVAPSVITHQLMHAFSINAAGLGVLSSAFYYSYTLMQVPGGLLLDRLGVRKLLTLAIFTVAIGITCFASAHTLWVAFIGRFLIGLGSSVAYISALYLITHWFDHTLFAILAGIMQLMGCIGSIIGQTFLAQWFNHAGWRNTFYDLIPITLGFAILFFILTKRQAREHIADKQYIKSSLLLQFKQAKKYPQLWWITLIGFVSWVPVTSIAALWGIPYIMLAFSVSNVAAGILCSLFWLGLGIGSPLIGWLSMKTHSRKLPAKLCFYVGLIAGILLLCIPHLNMWLGGIILFLLGFASSVQALSFGILKDVFPHSMFGLGSGILNMAVLLGGAISQPLVGFLLQSQWSGLIINNTPIYSIADYQHAFLILPVFSLLGLWVCQYRLKETHCKPLILKATGK